MRDIEKILIESYKPLHSSLRKENHPEFNIKLVMNIKISIDK